MHSLLHDVRYGLRMLVKAPGFTLVAVLTLALGIGANTAVFSVIDAVLLRPAPFAGMDRLMMVWETDRNSGTTREPASAPDFLDFQRLSSSLEQMGALKGEQFTLTPENGEPRRVAGLAVSHEFLPLLGVRPILGRSFSAAEDRAGASPVVMISEDLWERDFARDPGVLGRTLRLDDVPRTIIGVMPSQADYGALQVFSAAAYSRAFADTRERVRVQAWTPLQPDLPRFVRATHPIFVVGRLASGATPVAAQQELANIAVELEETYPQDNDGRGVHVEPLSEVIVGPVRPALLVLLGAVALVLLVACANVANLLLARSTDRVREVAVRASLGAGMGRLARQFLVENSLLALLGGGLGVLLAMWGTNALTALAPADIPRMSEVAMDARVLAVTLGIAVAVGIAFGFVPLLQVRHLDLQSALKAQPGRALSGSKQTGRLRSVLVVSELALAMMLVVAAGLLVRTFWNLMQVNAGFHPDGVLKAEFQLPRSRYPVDISRWPNFQEIHRFNAALLERASALPGVESAALAGEHPLDAGFTNSFVVVGREAEAQTWPEISIRRVSPGYFRTVGLPLVRGRSLSAADGTTEPPVLLINQAAARRFFLDQDPLGQQIAFWGAQRTIVGVVADEKFRGLAQPAPFAVYAPLAQAPAVNGTETLLLRVQGEPSAFASSARGAIAEVDPQLAIYAVEPLRETVSKSVGQERFLMLLLGLFGGVAVVLAILGAYGLLAYTTAQRAPEIAIRAALGATRSQVLALILRHGMELALAGIVIGTVGALLTTRLLSSLLFGIAATDAVTFATVAVLVFAAALLASYLPARRAAKVDPMVALRCE